MAIPSAAAAQEAPSAPPAAPTSAPQEDQSDIIVSGIRKSLETAQAIKQNSDQIIDSVIAEDIGKLPDASAAESLARLPGITVERSGGEASGVRLRGLPDLTTTYNGREIFTADGRQVALQDFPAGTISRIDVYKTSAANLIEAGIGGEIDVRSNKPLDFKKSLTVAGNAGGLLWYQSERIGKFGSLLVSKRWHTGIGEIGILVEGSYTDNNFIDPIRTENQIIQKRSATQTFPLGRYPAGITFDNPSSTRWRPAGDAALQWRPSNNLEFYADILYQGFRSKGLSHSLQVNTGTASVISNVTYCAGSTDLICKMTATGGNPTGSYQVVQGSRTDTYQGGGGFIWKLGQARITGDAAITDSVFKTGNFQVNTQTNATGTRIFDFNDPLGGGGSAQVQGIDLTDPAAWRMLSYTESSSRTHGHSVQARLDADIPVFFAIFDRLQAGIRYSDRDVDVLSATTVSVTPANTAALQFTTLPLDFQRVVGAFRGDPTTHPLAWILPTRDSIAANEDLIRKLAGRPAGTPPLLPVYNGTEISYTAYLQTHWGFNLGSVPIDGQIGLRVVRTEDDINGVLTVGKATPTPYEKTNQYNDFLPNVSARIKLTSNLQARLAFTKTRTRPAFSALNPTLTIAATQTCDNSVTPPKCFTSATSGNPDLKPTTSTDYDATLEYYFSRDGSAAIQVFRREVDGFINNTTTLVTDPTFGVLSVNQPANGQKGYINGVEVGFRSFLRIRGLPEWAKNFGVLTNFTYLDHCSELSAAAAATLPGCQPITNTSKYIANAQVFYENKFLSLRASYNYRSSYQTYGVVADPAITGTQPTLPTTVQGYGQMDLSASVNPTPQLGLTFSIANALHTPLRNSRVFNTLGESYPWQVQYLESTYRLSLRFRF